MITKDVEMPIAKYFQSFYRKIIQMLQQCANTLERGQLIVTKLTMDNLSFASAKYYLGSLCIRGHDWNQTGQTLRRLLSRCCVECERENAQKYRSNHPERSRASVHKYRRSHPETILAAQQRRRHSGSSAEVARRWRQKHPEYRKVHADRERLRRFRKKASRLIDYTSEQVRERFAEFDNCCAYCGNVGNLTLDHFIAIKRGGPDCLGNIVPACNGCNSSKRASEPLEWYQKQPFYSKKRWDLILSVLGRSSHTQMPLF